MRATQSAMSTSLGRRLILLLSGRCSNSVRGESPSQRRRFVNQQDGNTLVLGREALPVAADKPSIQLFRHRTTGPIA